MKISLILATLDRHEVLKRAICSLCEQDYQDLELIVIDQSDVYDHSVEELFMGIKYIHIDQKGLSHARNIGLSFATGDIIGFMDDDAIFDKNTLRKINNYFAEDPKVSFISGIIKDPDTNKYALPDMKKGKTYITIHNFLDICMSAAIFIRTNIMQDYKFDEDFGLGSFWGSAEESDLIYRILRSDGDRVGILYPDIVIYHKVLKKKDISLEKRESYCRGFGGMCSKHYNMFHDKYMLIRYIVSMLKSICGVVISALRMDKYMIHYYFKSILAKRTGYITYKEQRCCMHSK